MLGANCTVSREQILVMMEFDILTVSIYRKKKNLSKNVKPSMSLERRKKVSKNGRRKYLSKTTPGQRHKGSKEKDK